MELKTILKRYPVFILGLYFLSLGIVLIVRSALGTTPISSINYVLSINSALSLGTWTFLFNLLLIAGQFCDPQPSLQQSAPQPMAAQTPQYRSEEQVPMSMPEQPAPAPQPVAQPQVQPVQYRQPAPQPVPQQAAPQPQEIQFVVSLIQAADFCLKSTISLATSGLNFINRINFLFE